MNLFNALKHLSFSRRPTRDRYEPAFLPTFKALRTPVERADAWRYAALCRHGGIYGDTDTACLAPVEQWAARSRRRGAGDVGTSSGGGGGADSGGGEVFWRGGSGSGGRSSGSDSGGGRSSEAGEDDSAPGLLVGIENVFRSQEEAEEATYANKIQMVQWTVRPR